ncbi:hypothetical protein ANN_04367 [Periplaneta americana]|uniref:Reverse transcriptase domain-containing protein n=1 Tax=Periplaneta americana TaxID=6978 RepID=A0ABQ8TAA6_PERAM|nr:hypothetical protein ANN_04367 [Periplaneta americana]
MAGLREGGNEPAGSLKAIWGNPLKKPGNFHRPGFQPGPPDFAVRRANRYSTGVEMMNIIRHSSSNGKMEEQIEENQFGFRKRKGTRDPIGLLRTIGERYLEKNKEVYIVFVGLEKAFDRVD